jgi:hypothetical protein
MIDPFSHDEIIGMGIYGLFVVLAAIDRGRGPGLSRIIMAGEALAFALILFAPLVLAIGGVLGTLVAFAAAIFGVRPLRRIGLLAIAAMLVFACVTTFDRSPTVLIVAGLAPIFLVLTRRAALALSPESVFRALVLALLGFYVYRNTDTAWFALTPLVPGA